MSERFDENQLAHDSSENEVIYYSLEVTTTMTRLGPAVVERCVQIGLVHPVQRNSEPARYSQADVIRLRKVRRLIQELGLNWAGVEVVMRLTDELEQVRAELARLRRGL
ncbi:MAG TPA: chaperone modulator CbpM [Chloroflexia bacterium]|nr:chaperone modulator CbpM [Chloroflexia bacterium]